MEQNWWLKTASMVKNSHNIECWGRMLPVWVIGTRVRKQVKTRGWWCWVKQRHHHQQQRAAIDEPIFSTPPLARTMAFVGLRLQHLRKSPILAASTMPSRPSQKSKRSKTSFTSIGGRRRGHKREKETSTYIRHVCIKVVLVFYALLRCGDVVFEMVPDSAMNVRRHTYVTSYICDVIHYAQQCVHARRSEHC